MTTLAVLAYIAAAAVTWLAVAVAAARYWAADGHRGTGPVPPPSGEDIAFGVALGMFAAIAWPLAVLGACAWRVVRHVIHATEETPR
jgi:hypothetical protein